MVLQFWFRKQACSTHNSIIVKNVLRAQTFLFFLGLSSLDPRMEMTPDPKRRQVVIQIGKILSFKSISYNQFLPGQVNEPFWALVFSFVKWS